MLENQILEELLRERANYYLSKNKIKDFWILINPNFLRHLNEKIAHTNFFSQQKSELIGKICGPYYSCLISVDKDFIKWVQLRLGYFEIIETDEFFQNSLISPTYLLNEGMVSDGLFGEIRSNIESPLANNKYSLSPKIITQKFENAIEIYQSTIISLI